MLGSPSSGKTALMEHVVQQSLPDVSPMYHTHYRPPWCGCDIWQRLLRDICWNTYGVLSNLNEHFKRMKFSAGLATIEFPDKKKETVSLFKALDIRGNKFEKPFSLMHGHRPCVLVIDEANESIRLAPQEPSVWATSNLFSCITTAELDTSSSFKIRC